MKKPILKAASIFFSACLLFGCGKTPQETKNNTPTISVTLEDETITGQEQNHTENTADVDLDGENQNSLDLKDHLQENNGFQLLENYKEKNIPPVYTQENENESYCNAHFNKDGELEYYTLEKKTIFVLLGFVVLIILEGIPNLRLKAEDKWKNISKGMRDYGIIV